MVWGAMRYLATASGQRVRDAMEIGLLDQIVTPGRGCTRQPGIPFAIDNGRFGKGWPGYDVWWERLQEIPREGCLFAVAPDVVGDAAATLADSLPWMPRIRELGFPVAYVAQDGQEDLPMPWDEFDVLFLGGRKQPQEWKLGPAAADLAREAQERGKKVHMGRVNSRKRIRHAHSLKCDTVDGTLLAFGPDRNLMPLLRWMLEVL